MNPALRVSPLTREQVSLYEGYVSGKADGLVYYSLQYRRFLEEYLGSECRYLIAWDGETIRGVLPLMLCDGKYGRVCNSLPLFGSHGGILADDSVAFETLVDAYNEIGTSEELAASTLIGNPLSSPDYARLACDCTDARIGQFTPISHDRDHADRLMATFHYKTRNMIRKASKQGIVVDTSGDHGDFMMETHWDNIAAMGGIYKDEAYFRSLLRHFPHGTGSRIYVAMIRGKPIAALLVLYYNRIVEYFTPVIKRDYRALQPMSLLIYRAMCDASVAGYRLWNWGGTWLSQQGVYRFKNRWGTINTPYTYYTKIHDPNLRKLSQLELSACYPHFFVLPYHLLEATSRQEVPGHMHGA